MNYEELFYHYYGYYPTRQELQIFIDWYEGDGVRSSRRRQSSTLLPLMILMLLAILGYMAFSQFNITAPPAPTATMIHNGQAIQIVTTTPGLNLATLVPTQTPIILPTGVPHTPAQNTHCQLDSNLEPMQGCE